MSDTLAEELAESHPDSAPDLIIQADEPAANAPGVVDRQGRAFDPALHVTNKDGTPRLTKLGALRVRRQTGSIPPPGVTTKPPPSDEPAPPDYAAMGKLVTFSLIVAAKSIGGAEWEPDDSAEREAMEQAWESYLRARGVPDLPPGFVLCVALGTYSAKRFQRPDTRGRVARWWVKSRLRRLFRWGRNARADFGANGDGKDDAGDDVSARVPSGVQSTFVDDSRPVR